MCSSSLQPWLDGAPISLVCRVQFPGHEEMDPPRMRSLLGEMGCFFNGMAFWMELDRRCADPRHCMLTHPHPCRVHFGQKGDPEEIFAIPNQPCLAGN